MKPRTLRYRTFAEIVNEMAKEHHGDWWRARRDDYLEPLIQDFWFGCFTDTAGQSCMFDLGPRQTDAPAPVTREQVWRLLGYYGRPQTVRDAREDSPKPWNTMGAAKIEDYGCDVPDVFKNFALSEADARAWTEQYDKENSPRIQVGTQHTSSAVPPEPAIVAGGASRASEGGRPTLKDETEAPHRNLLGAGEVAEHAAAVPTKAETNKIFARLHQKFLDNNSRPATVMESYKLARIKIGVGRDRARELRQELPSHLKNQRRRPPQK